MLPAVLRVAPIQEEVPDDAPGRRDLELHEEIQESVDDYPPLDLAAPPKGLRPE
jgi:hypothetical protein